MPITANKTPAAPRPNSIKDNKTRPKVPKGLGLGAFPLACFDWAEGGVRDMRAIVVVNHYKKSAVALVLQQKREEIDASLVQFSGGHLSQAHKTGVGYFNAP
jgi:hypothetical protein